MVPPGFHFHSRGIQIYYKSNAFQVFFDLREFLLRMRNILLYFPPAFSFRNDMLEDQFADTFGFTDKCNHLPGDFGKINRYQYF